MPEALTAWLSTPDRWIGLNYEPGSLEIGQNAQGGYTDATLRLQESINSKDPILGAMTRLVVTDAATARVVWEGYLDLPGRERGDEGDLWEIGAVGPSARLSDRKLPYIVFDSQLGSWRFLFGTNGNMTGQQGALPTNEDVDALVLTFPQGIPIGNESRVTMVYGALVNAGQKLGQLYYVHREGLASTDNKVELLAGTYLSGTEEIARQQNMATTFNESGATVGVDFVNGRDRPKVRLRKVTGGATNVVGDNHWSGITELEVTARRRNIAGTQITGPGSYPNRYVLAHEVITDALWHFDTAIDPALAQIDTFTHQIDQLAYTDPVTFQEVLEDLALLEGDLLWEVLESGPNGHRFNARRLTDDVRYLADARDGWSSPGAEADPRNSITVAWTDRAGATHSKTYTASDVRALDQWGITRDADLVELGDELGSEANADRIGPAILEAANAAPPAGTLIVTRPVHDTFTGQDVMPWEIQPGYRVDIADVDMDPIPITERTYQNGVATLTCGEPVLTTEQIVNKLTRRRRGR